jgi:Family of unknown function (DUF5683)
LLQFLKLNFLLLALSLTITLSAQDEPSIINPNVANAQDTIGSDSILPKVNTFKTIFNGKPGRAALYSLVVPSGGQIYNKKWWKVPLALGLDGYFIYNVINKKSTYNQFNNIVLNYQNNAMYIDPFYSKSQAINLRSQARSGVENAWVYLVIGHLVTVFDAYVDRHLKDFDISPNLSFDGTPNPESLGSIAFISIKYRLR